MNFNKQLFILFLNIGCIFPSTLLQSQRSLTATELLTTANNESTVQLSSSKIQYLSNADHTLPIIEELEFRTETNDFDWKEQEYTLRTQLNTKRERNAQKQFHQANITLHNIEQEVALKEALLQRYDWLADWLTVQNAIKSNERLLALCQDKLAVLKKTVGDTNFKIKDLIRAEEEVLEIEHELNKWNDRKARLRSELATYTKNISTVQVNIDDILTTPELITLVEKHENSQHIALTRKQQRAELINKEYEVELSGISNPINYAQVKVGGRNNELFREWVSVGVGLKLPFKGDNKLDLNELELDKIEELGELDILKKQLEEDERQLVERMRQLLQEKIFLKNQLDNSQAKYTLNQLLKSETPDPIDILDLQEIVLKREIAIEKIDFEILELYIEWLDVSDKVMEKPLRNHLAKNQEVLFNN